MKKNFIVTLFFLTLLSCSQEKEIEEVIFEGQYEDTSKLKYILSEDMNDNIIGYGIFNAESNDEFFDIKELERRDFKPDKVIYYSNDTKNTDNVLYYEGEILISYQRFAYKMFEKKDQISIDFK